MHHEIRCGNCRRKLGEGHFLCLIIKCPRCGTMNHLRASTPHSHACERPNPSREDAYGDIKKSTPTQGTPYARGEFERAFEISHDPLVRAQRAIVRSFLSFHHESLFDLRKKTFADARHGNNSSKAYAWRNYPRALVQICRRLQGVIIERRDALEVIRAQDRPQTLFFIDPPYLPQTRSKSGYRHEMSHEQHVQLLQRLQTIQGRAVVAGYPSELYDDLLSGWKRVERSHYANGSKRPRTEVLWISPAAG